MEHREEEMPLEVDGLWNARATDVAFSDQRLQLALIVDDLEHGLAVLRNERATTDDDPLEG